MPKSSRWWCTNLGNNWREREREKERERKKIKERTQTHRHTWRKKIFLQDIQDIIKGKNTLPEGAELFTLDAGEGDLPLFLLSFSDNSLSEPPPDGAVLDWDVLLLDADTSVVSPPTSLSYGPNIAYNSFLHSLAEILFNLKNATKNTIVVHTNENTLSTFKITSLDWLHYI